MTWSRGISHTCKIRRHLNINERNLRHLCTWRHMETSYGIPCNFYLELLRRTWSIQRCQLQRTSDFTPYPGCPGSELSRVTGQLWGRIGDEFQHHLWVLFLAFRQDPCPYWGRKDSCLGSSFVVCHPSNWKQVLPLLSSSVYLGWWMCLSHLIFLKRTAPFSQFWEATRKMLVGNVKLVAVYLPQHRPMTSGHHHSWTGQKPTLALPLSIEGSRISLCFSTGKSLHLLPKPHQRPETVR